MRNMSGTPGKRTRARAVFRSELPLRVLPAVVEEQALHLAARMVAQPIQNDREIADELLRVATRYQNSVKLRANFVTKLAVGPTLRSLAAQSASLSQCLSERTVRHHVDTHLELLPVRNFEAGVDAIHAAAEIVEHVGDVLGVNASVGPSLANEVAHAETRLSRAAEIATVLARMLTNLPMRCEWELVLLQQYEVLMPAPSGKAEGAHFVRELTSNLTRHALAAAELISQIRGPSPNTPQMLAVLELKSIFERRTGSPATQSMKSGRTYSGRPESRFGLFATAAFNMMEPDERRRRGLSEAITSAVWPSRSCAKAIDVAAQANDREHAVYEALQKASLQTSRPRPHR
jgi:hypothetical protein